MPISASPDTYVQIGSPQHMPNHVHSTICNIQKLGYNQRFINYKKYKLWYIQSPNRLSYTPQNELPHINVDIRLTDIIVKETIHQGAYTVRFHLHTFQTG